MTRCSGKVCLQPYPRAPCHAPLFPQCRHNLLYPENEQANADKHSDHRNNHAGTDKDHDRDEDKQCAGDHLRVVIVDAHGDVGLQAAQVGGDEQADDAERCDPCGENVDDKRADKRLKEIADDERRTEHERNNRADQLIVFGEAERFSLLPDADLADCMENHEQPDNPRHHGDGRGGGNDAVNASDGERRADDKPDDFVNVHRKNSFPRFICLK